MKELFTTRVNGITLEVTKEDLQDVRTLVNLMNEAGIGVGVGHESLRVKKINENVYEFVGEVFMGYTQYIRFTK